MPRCSSHSPLLLVASLWLCAGCHTGDAVQHARADTHAMRVDTHTTRFLVDTQPITSLPAPVPAPHPAPASTAPKLSPRADAIAQMLVFFVNGQTWLTAAVRHKRLVVDLGRVDVPIRTAAQRRAYQEAVRAESPIHVGDRLRLHGPWGSDDAIVTGFADVSGRIVARLELPPSVDSLVRVDDDALVAVAARADSAQPPVVDSCPRDSVSDTLAARLSAVEDSLQRRLRADTLQLPEQLKRSIWVRSSHAIGCFGPARALAIVTLASSGYDYVREAAVLLDDTGRVTPLRLSPLRFKAHAVLLAFDADGDGVDDVAVSGRGQRVGGTAVMRLDPKRRQLDFLTQGFAWEER